MEFPREDDLELSPGMLALGHLIIVRPSENRVRVSVDKFDLIWRSVTQLGRYFLAHDAVEKGVVDFDLHIEQIDELRDARASMDADVLELIGWGEVK